ncbi:hypothetical protein V8G54_009579, partial [Vigna mungo]
ILIIGRKSQCKSATIFITPITNLIKLHGHKNKKKKLWKQIDFKLREVWLTIINSNKFYECLIYTFTIYFGRTFLPLTKQLLVKIPPKCTNLFLYPSKKKVAILYNEKSDSATTSGSGSIIGQ